MKFKVSWIDLVGFYTHIEADSKEEAVKKFHDGEIDGIEPDGFCETETDSVEAKEDDE